MGKSSYSWTTYYPFFVSESESTVDEAMLEFLFGDAVTPEKRNEYSYLYHDAEAVNHLFQVSASLDSMVVGETQILGQIKEAYRYASRFGCTGPLLNRLMHKSFTVAKRVRNETGIGSSAVSISYAAVQLARKIFGNLDDKKVCHSPCTDQLVFADVKTLDPGKPLSSLLCVHLPVYVLVLREVY